MNLLDKIKNDFNSLTAEDFELINQDPVLVEALVEAIPINKPGEEVLNLIGEDLFKKIIFREPVFMYFLDFLRKQSSEEEFLEEIFTNDFIFSDFLTAENSEMAYKLSKKVRDSLFNKIIDMIKTNPEFKISTGSLEVIKFIIDNKMYDKADFISLDPEYITEEIEDFLIEALKNNSDIVLKVRTPKITEYCLQNACIHRIIGSFNPKNEDEMSILKEAIEKDLVTYEQIKNSYVCYYINDSPKFIIQKLMAGDYLNEEQIAYIKEHPEFLKQIISILKNTDADNYAIYSLAKDFPEIQIWFIENNIGYCAWDNHSVLEEYISEKSEELLKLLDERHDLLLDAVKNFIINNSDQRLRIAKAIILRDDLAEIRDVVFKTINLYDYSQLIEDYIKASYQDYSKEIRKLCEFIELNNINLFIVDTTIYYQHKLDFDVYMTLLKKANLTAINDIIMNLYSISNSYNFTPEQLQEILTILIDQAIENNLTSISFIVSQINQLAKPEDKQKVLDNLDKLGLSINDRITLGGDLKGKSYDELVTYFGNGRIIPYSFENVARFVDESNFEIIRWMLNSPSLEIGNSLFNVLRNLRNVFSNKNFIDRYDSYLKEFYIKTKNIPIEYTYAMDDETILKATLDCDDSYYLTNLAYFELNNYYSNDNYYQMLFNKIKERVALGKQVNFMLITKCLNKIRIESDDELKQLIDSNAVYWDAKDTSIEKAFECLNNSNFEDFIRKTVIPSIKIGNLQSFNVIRDLARFTPDFLNKLEELVNNGEQLSGNVLILLNVDNSDYYSDFLEKLYEKNLFNFNNISFSNFRMCEFLDKVIFDRAIQNINVVEKNLNFLLGLGKKAEEAIAKQIDETQSVPISFVFKDVRKYPLIFQAVLKALREGRISTNYNLGPNLFDVDILKEMFDYSSSNIQSVITYLVHNYHDPKPEIMEFLAPYICKYNNLSLEVFKYLYKVYGNTVIPLLENENFIFLCNQDLKNVKKLTALLEPRVLDKKMVEGINNSIRQNIFAYKNPQILTTFTTILAKIQNNVFEEEREYYLNLLLPAVPDNLEKDIIITKNELLLEYYKSDKRQFLNYLFDCLKMNQNTYSSVFNKITTEYVLIKRNEYGSQDDIFKDTKVDFYYDKKVLYDTLFSELLNNERRTLFRILEIPTYFLREGTFNRENYGEYAVDYYTIQFLLGKDISSDLTKDELIQVKKNISTLKNKFYKAIEDNTHLGEQLPDAFKHYLDNPEFEKKLKKVLIFNKRDRDLNKEFPNLNLQVLFNKILNDEEKYNELLSLIQKYRILDWFDLFEPTISQLSISNDIENLYSFINAFNQIYDAEKKLAIKARDEKAELMRKRGDSEEDIEEFLAQDVKIHFNAYKILKYCAIYSSIPNCYKVFLGLDDFDVIKKNEGPNASSYAIEDRLVRACEVHLKAIKQQETSIPSFITDKTVSSGKKLRCIVGNRAHPRNMSHGERTGACMRAYGYADSESYGPRSNNLFEFCATNFNGFHITFVNPETDEYVSRVSGFRNGNTVFLNQLRNVVKENHDYTDEDVIEMMKLVSEEIIEMSKDSEYPIENVVASPCYALTSKTTQPLSDSDIGKGVYSGYRDVNVNAVVLATTGKDGLAVQLDLDSSRHPHYKCVRVYPKEIIGDLSSEDKINLQRISAIRGAIDYSNNNPEYRIQDYLMNIDFDIEALDQEYVYTIIGQDWFIALNTRMEIKSDIISLDDRAQLEFDEAMKKVEAYKAGDYTMSGGLING